MKKNFYYFVILAILTIGFSACNSLSGTYNLEGGYVLTIDSDGAVRLKTPDGKIVKGNAQLDELGIPFLQDVHARVSLSESIEIMHIKESLWVIDKNIKYLYEDGIFTHYWESKDEDHRIRIISHY